jgi:hypothetical protein
VYKEETEALSHDSERLAYYTEEIVLSDDHSEDPEDNALLQLADTPRGSRLLLVLGGGYSLYENLLEKVVSLY